MTENEIFDIKRNINNAKNPKQQLRIEADLHAVSVKTLRDILAGKPIEAKPIKPKEIKKSCAPKIKEMRLQGCSYDEIAETLNVTYQYVAHTATKNNCSYKQLNNLDLRRAAEYRVHRKDVKPMITRKSACDALIPTVVHMRCAGLRYTEISKLTELGYNTVVAICRRHEI